MFGIGGPELVFIFILALLIFGPKRLPQIGRTIGKGMAEFRKASTELQRAVNTELEEPPAWRTQAAAAVAAPAAVAAAATVAPVAPTSATSEPAAPPSAAPITSSESAGDASAAGGPTTETTSTAPAIDDESYAAMLEELADPDPDAAEAVAGEADPTAPTRLQ